MKQWKNIIVHCSDSEWGNTLAIDGWHREKGWAEIGYHYVILNGKPFSVNEYIDLFNGTLEPGRKIDFDLWVENNETGAHALGYNSDSIGICMIGKEDFTTQQFVTLKFIIQFLQKQYPSIVNVMGHCDTKSGKEQGKTCPNFNVDKFMIEYLVGIGAQPV